MPTVPLRLDEATHRELSRRKEAERKRLRRRVLPWEEFVANAIRAYKPENVFR